MKNIVLLITSAIACVALMGCGNKGPLVKPSDIPVATPQVTPAGEQPVENPVVKPSTTPAAEPASDTPAAPR